MLKMLTESQMLKNLQQKSLNILWYKGENRKLDQIIRNNTLVNFLGHFLASKLLSLLSFKCCGTAEDLFFENCSISDSFGPLSDARAENQGLCFSCLKDAYCFGNSWQFS